MTLSHITYCLTTWSLNTDKMIKSVQSVYKQALKVLDNKPKSYYHCNIRPRYGLLSLENLIQFNRTRLM